ncbi:metallo-beta-lactamase [Pseudomonas sp. ATCC 13867]|uniref:MBL fold metallo-hydrolase n=1 Tax=Pseudomonas sp. ATCC 13867 TaxID=1294143 RepID=UPI0002C4DFED|nr:MBL fold metallo-hydrolase [Pseudomonas sp. ATCC 13867]AGI24807.1 metallo-beta-lactamase [Pseudomonas sp. ATCC 13867]RFQ25336.1 MBL fold metallo-hydrolase [Pseudomonas sp. ATCC 13867]
MSGANEPLVYPCGEPPAPGSAREVAPGVFWLRMPLPLALDHINLWLVRDGSGWAAFDSGMHEAETEAAWRQLVGAGGVLEGVPPGRLFVTHMHPDHVGMAGWLQREFGSDLWMTQTEYLNCRMLAADTGREAPEEGVSFYRAAGWEHEALERYRERFGGFGRMISPMPQSYRRVQDGEWIRIGGQDWQVLVGTGHSPEHACFYNPEQGLLISGDQVLPRISSNVSVFPTEPLADPLGDWLQSLERFQRLVPDDVLVLPAHGEPFRGLHARLQRMADSQLRALSRLEGRLQQGPKRAVDLFGALFARAIGPDLLSLATGECLANLNYLLRRGRAVVEADSDGVHWYRAPAPAPTMA